MEAQEFGAMMELVVEVNFSLDGLKNGQPLRIKRASLLSLLRVCGISTTATAFEDSRDGQDNN
ncbi:hypothetical protein NC651_009803 [Populus alba x Populus x berolinensis]|nr:hypothetical protein NC651_009803 [Populus alba x Populus x berolinensis]